MGVGTLRISELLILRGSTGECGGPGSAPGGGDPQGSGGSLRPPARSYRGSGSPNSLAGMNCQTWPRAGRDEPVIIFKFAIIDLRKSCGDKDELICKFIGEINPAVIKKPPLRCRGGGPVLGTGEGAGNPPRSHASRAARGNQRCSRISPTPRLHSPAGGEATPLLPGFPPPPPPAPGSPPRASHGRGPPTHIPPVPGWDRQLCCPGVGGGKEEPS